MLYVKFSSMERWSCFARFAWCGQIRMHSPQSMQRSLVMTALPLRTRIASVGQRLMQFVQPTHLLTSSVTEWKKIPNAYASSFISGIQPHGFALCA